VIARNIMKKPEKLSQEVVDLLLPRLQDEFNASYLYRAASNWCRNVGFFKAADFFAKESEDELKHAKNIENYLTDWNVSPALPTIEKPEIEFKDLVDIIEKAYGIEFKLYGDYEDTSAKVLKMNELATFDFLQQYRKIQNDSVAEYSDKLNILDGVEPTKMNMLLLEENLFGE
jgi:ferritin